MNFSAASKVMLGTPLRMKGVQIGRVGGARRAARGARPA
jgi:ABC-type transporter Mla subunit MlaD